MNVSGIGKRTSALESNLQVVRKYRELKARWVLDSNLAVGDKIILSGTIGDHGLAVLSAQQGLKFGSQILSDVKPLNRMIQSMLGNVGGVVAMKDPTRGGSLTRSTNGPKNPKLAYSSRKTKFPSIKTCKPRVRCSG